MRESYFKREEWSRIGLGLPPMWGAGQAFSAFSRLLLRVSDKGLFFGGGPRNGGMSLVTTLARPQFCVFVSRSFYVVCPTLAQWLKEWRSSSTKSPYMSCRIRIGKAGRMTSFASLMWKTYRIVPRRRETTHMIGHSIHWFPT